MPVLGSAKGVSVQVEGEKTNKERRRNTAQPEAIASDKRPSDPTPPLPPQTKPFQTPTKRKMLSAVNLEGGGIGSSEL